MKNNVRTFLVPVDFFSKNNGKTMLRCRSNIIRKRSVIYGHIISSYSAFEWRLCFVFKQDVSIVKQQISRRNTTDTRQCRVLLLSRPVFHIVYRANAKQRYPSIVVVVPLHTLGPIVSLKNREPHRCTNFFLLLDFRYLLYWSCQRAIYLQHMQSKT